MDLGDIYEILKQCYISEVRMYSTTFPEITEAFNGLQSFSGLPASDPAHDEMTGKQFIKAVSDRGAMKDVRVAMAALR